MQGQIVMGVIGTIQPVPLGLWEGALFSNVNAFLMLMIILSGILGLTSGYAAIGAYGSFAIFARIAMETDLWLFNSLLYVITAIIFVVMGMQVFQYVSGDI